MVDTDTWNTCPDCGEVWKDERATPGLLHRTRLCAACAPPRPGCVNAQGQIDHYFAEKIPGTKCTCGLIMFCE